MTGADLLYQAETDILKEIARLLRGGFVDSAEWKASRLAKMGHLTTFARETIQRYIVAVRNATASEVEERAMAALLKGERIFEKAKKAGADLWSALPPGADPAIKRIIGIWQKAATERMNFAATTLLHNSGQLYMDTINKATLNALTGSMSTREALVRTVREWASSGVPSIVDRAGRTWSTEAYAGMVVRSNVRRVTTEVQMERCQEYGCDLIEVSAHSGARPGCEPYQGRIYSLSGNSPDYPPFSETSYGEPAGLFGINCGHMQYPFFPGLSRQTYAPTEDKDENDRIYAESQEQRRLEREIRAAKREESVFDALGDKDAANWAAQKVNDRQEAMRDFIDRTGRTRRSAREQIYD